MVTEDRDSFVVSFMDTIKTDDESSFYILKHCGLPEWCDIIDEECVGVTLCDETKDMTVNDFVNILTGIGMKYNPNAVYGDCKFKELLTSNKKMRP
jgi:hypothetical protein